MASAVRGRSDDAVPCGVRSRVHSLREYQVLRWLVEGPTAPARITPGKPREGELSDKGASGSWVGDKRERELETQPAWASSRRRKGKWRGRS